MVKDFKFMLGMVLAAGIFYGSGISANAQEAANSDAATSGQEPPTDQAAQLIAGNWTVNCQPQADGKTLDCVLSQSIIVAQTQEVFVTLSIRPAPENTVAEPYVAVARLPHGLALDAGVEYQIDAQQPGQMTFFTSNAQGVFARVGLSDDLLSSLQKGRQLEITFSARNGNKFIVPMSLTGFSASFEKLK